MRKAFCIGLSALVVLSCSRIPLVEDDASIVLGVEAPSAGGATRASSSENLLTRVFASGDRLGVFVEPVSHYGAAAKTFQYVSDDGTATTLFRGNPEPVFFQAAGNVDIHAFYPATVVANATRSSTVGFSVASDQSTRAAYAASDLMYGSATDVAHTPNPVPLAMTHALSRLTLRFSAGSATAAEQAALLAQLAGSTITLGGTVLTSIEGFNLGSPASAYTVGSANGAPVTFVTGANLAFWSSAGDPEYSVILPPQTLSTSTVVTVTPSGGDPVWGTLPSALVLERGKEAVITFSVVNRELTLAAIELVPWPGTPTGTGSVVF